MNTHTSNASLAAVIASNPKATALKPEWLRIPDAIRISGICRSSIYELITDGSIKSFCHRKRGAIRDQRLISYDSLVDYLNAEAAEAMGN
ncbi:MAG: helix-turn-helix domain-containing protein [Verrucomicrobiota bacterium]